ncbi:VOC family protein [Vitiosangium sp. GDMCC 1.1324]|uniref:VOC family protein n=1 Tax=Vitiosangium sp. (strain GDMCC 1.1324) TaxID=2138576 RepID=UPI000D3D294E|nr:VOC family protein [Vitiosangium sp. GDMCC 1.1324]PTL84758.1 glyoxalase [Vitiosangium sp. GDMCC 1.1324]
MAPPVRILRLDHVQLTIPKGMEDAARAFYCGTLGMAEREKPDALKGRGGFWLQLSGFQVHIGTEDGVERLRTKAHPAFEVEDLDAVRQVLEQAGIATEDGVPIPGMRRFECRDPFGNRLEFLQMEPSR